MQFLKSPRIGPGRFGLYSTWRGVTRKWANLLPGGGEKERARRRKQIAEGRLRVENGLMLKDAPKPNPKFKLKFKGQ